ncbi:hypothetical protein ACIP88_32765 [Streptomyces uncialis]|uniref:hypothetical protein n=1 Tax=Streptomyces uncialis TaxID=1048205 RepID=UPI003821C999
MPDRRMWLHASMSGPSLGDGMWPSTNMPRRLQVQGVLVAHGAQAIVPVTSG